MRVAKKKGGTAPTVPTLNIAHLVSRASPRYRLPPLGSTELAARTIGERFRLSPAIARTVVELAGYGGRA